MTQPYGLAGNDPYDALRSPRLPGFVRERRYLRQLAVQLRKRCPIDLSSALGIKPFVMAKTVGCYLTAAARFQSSGTVSAGETATNVRELVAELDACEGNAGDGGWGYEFDVQTRWAFYPKGSANIIATAFVGRGLLEASVTLHDEALLERASQASAFVVRELWDDHGGFFRYTSGSDRLVHNANYLGAGFVAAVAKLTDEPELLELAATAVETSGRAQREVGFWPYGEGEGLGWVDSFHTAYNLDGLLITSLAGVRGADAALSRGMADWQSHFFRADGRPLYYRDRLGYADIHAAATAVDLLARWAATTGESGLLAHKVGSWTEDNLVASDGSTYFRQGRFGTDKRHFVRWGDAHRAMAQASLACLDAGVRTPLERRLEES